MAAARSIGVPELAGVGSYKEALKIGLSVEENVRRLVRFHWVEQRLAGIVVARIAETPEWEVKEALSLHLYLASEHVKLIRQRVSEMRNPPPRMVEDYVDEPLPTGTTIPDLSGNGLDATVEENDSGALVVGEGDANFDDNTTASKVAGSGAGTNTSWSCARPPFCVNRFSTLTVPSLVHPALTAALASVSRLRAPATPAGL